MHCGKRENCMRTLAGRPPEGAALHLWHCYLARCADDSLYCGVTLNVEGRLFAHNSGKGAKYTRARRPCVLLLARAFPDQASAMRAERRVKKTPRARKPTLLEELAQTAWKYASPGGQ